MRRLFKDNPVWRYFLGGMLTLSLALPLGCARWNRPSWTVAEKVDEAPTTVPAQAIATAADSVNVETAMVRFDETRLEQLQQAWLAADESIIDIEHRKTLDLNGLRVGVIRGELPKSIVSQFELVRSQQRTDVVEQLGLGSDADSRAKLLTCRSGRRKELVVRRELQQPLSVVTTTGGTISGHVFERASTVFALTMYPQPNGTAIAELIPEVQHGEPRKSFVTGDYGMRQELKRESKHWKQFKIRATLSTGDVLMLSATNPSKALGRAFFITETPQQAEEQLVLLVRLASTHQDDLFGSDVVEQARGIMETQ